MRLSERQLRRVIRESILLHENHPPKNSATEIYMDMQRKGGADHFVAIAHEKPGMDGTQFVNCFEKQSRSPHVLVIVLFVSIRR